MHSTYYRETGVWSHTLSSFNVKNVGGRNKIMNKAYGIIWNNSRQAWVLCQNLRAVTVLFWPVTLSSLLLLLLR
ncbi:hypothetical protein FVC00_22975 [Salmonella enterica]|nr:hypothetical protein [Salmonella enterica]